MYAVYQSNYRVSPTFNTIEDAGDWQAKFTGVLTSLEVKKFETSGKELTPEMKQARAKIKGFRTEHMRKRRGKTS